MHASSIRRSTLCNFCKWTFNHVQVRRVFPIKMINVSLLEAFRFTLEESYHRCKLIYVAFQISPRCYVAFNVICALTLGVSRCCEVVTCIGQEEPHSLFLNRSRLRGRKYRIRCWVVCNQVNEELSAYKAKF